MDKLTFIALVVICFAAWTAKEVDFEVEPTPTSKIYWSDADSGRLDGEPFRLANVDAPEKGGVGAIGGAKCEEERVRAFKAKEYIVELTRDADVAIARSYGYDKYDRLVVDLQVNGEDLAALGMREGVYKPWPHKGQRALARKPDWCGVQVALAG